eukprot:629885-Rhodomonas_salina.1
MPVPERTRRSPWTESLQFMDCGSSLKSIVRRAVAARCWRALKKGGDVKKQFVEEEGPSP